MVIFVSRPVTLAGKYYFRPENINLVKEYEKSLCCQSDRIVKHGNEIQDANVYYRSFHDYNRYKIG